MRTILLVAEVLAFLSVVLGWISLVVISTLGLETPRVIVESAFVLTFITVSDVITYRTNRRRP